MGTVGVRQMMFACYARSLDKNGQLRGARKGEKRRGVGRPPRGPRSSEPHKRRERFRRCTPVHVIIRVHESIASLRRADAMAAIRRALVTTAKRRLRFRICHFTVQNKHLHLIVEADDNFVLAKGMQGFEISAAKHLNAALRQANGRRRRGTVFPDRYHAVRLTSPRQVRNTLNYVLNNWRHHREDRRVNWRIDPFSSAVTFDGWRDGRFRIPLDYVVPLVWLPLTWLLARGWRKRGLIDPDDVPS